MIRKIFIAVTALLILASIAFAGLMYLRDSDGKRWNVTFSTETCFVDTWFSSPTVFHSDMKDKFSYNIIFSIKKATKRDKKNLEQFEFGVNDTLVFASVAVYGIEDNYYDGTLNLDGVYVHMEGQAMEMLNGNIDREAIDSKDYLLIRDQAERVWRAVRSKQDVSIEIIVNKNERKLFVLPKDDIETAAAMYDACIKEVTGRSHPTNPNAGSASSLGSGTGQ